ncbi:P-loop NTPase [Ammonifex thiophilus]|uniref:nucleotide-binding protein n=1 Tax=Ammonifex thiophilus TaxID=444093 RepID=UPI001F0C1A03|nr:P-loop NTPase [Ammonifex thiophilus]
MLCLLAVEEEVAQVVRANLERAFPSWRFETATSAGELKGWAGRNVDVLVLSRFLPGEDPVRLLKKLREFFPVSHVVLLAGAESDAQRAYVRAAKELGFTGIVTGRLPGDRPYTIFEALREVEKELEEERTMEELTPVEIPPVKKERGMLVLVAANKGGVGKTTVAVSLAVALARGGVPVALVDYDFASPDATAFFGLKGTPGVELLAGKPVTGELLRRVLVRARPGVDVLPGPADGAVPPFRAGQVTEITRELLKMYPVVVGDTPAAYVVKPWLKELFGIAEYVLAVVDQSRFSEHNVKSYAAKLLEAGVKPERMGIVLNRFSPRLASPKKVENWFKEALKGRAKAFPMVVAVVPSDWEAHVRCGHKGKVVGLEDPSAPWHRLAERIAAAARHEYRPVKRSFFARLFSKS